MRTLALAAAVFATCFASASAQSVDGRRLGNGVVPQATTDPLVMIYRVSGVSDSGGAGSGVATVINCSSFSTVAENVRIRIFANSGVTAGDANITLQPRETVTVATHDTNLHTNETLPNLSVQVVTGHATIVATSVNVFCTAMIVNAGGTTPNGIDLHMVRFNPIPQTSE